MNAWTLIEIVKRPVRALAFLPDDQSLSPLDALVNNGPVGWAGGEHSSPRGEGGKIGLSFGFLGEEEEAIAAVGGYCLLEGTMSREPFLRGKGKFNSAASKKARISLVKGFACCPA